MEEKVEKEAKLGKVQGPKVATKAYVSDWDQTLTREHTFAKYHLAIFVDLPQWTVIDLIRYGFQHSNTIFKEGIPQYLFDPFAEESICAIATYHNNDCFIMGCLLYLMIQKGLIVLKGSTLKIKDIVSIKNEDLNAIIENIIINRTVIIDESSSVAISNYTINGCERPFYICHIPATGAEFKKIEKKLHGKNEMLLFIERTWKLNDFLQGNSITFYEDTAKNIDWLANEEWADYLKHIQPFLVDRTGTFVARGISFEKPASFYTEVPDTPRAPLLDTPKAANTHQISALGTIPFFSTTVSVPPCKLSEKLDNNAALRKQLVAFHASVVPVKTVASGHCLLLNSKKDREDLVTALNIFGLEHMSYFDNWGALISCKDIGKQRGSYYHYDDLDVGEDVVALDKTVYKNKWVLFLSIDAMEMYYEVSKYADDFEQEINKAVTLHSGTVAST